IRPNAWPASSPSRLRQPHEGGELVQNARGAHNTAPWARRRTLRSKSRVIPHRRQIAGPFSRSSSGDENTRSDQHRVERLAGRAGSPGAAEHAIEYIRPEYEDENADTTGVPDFLVGRRRGVILVIPVLQRRLRRPQR